MKKYFFIAALFSVFCFTANAQMVQKSPQQRAAHMTKVLQKQLNLSADQYSTVNMALQNQAMQMDSLKGNMSPDKKVNNMTRKSISQTTRQQILSVLNDDQKKQYMALEQAKKEKHMQKRAQATDMPTQ